MAHLPLVAQHLEQPQMVSLTLERWLHELKVALPVLIGHCVLLRPMRRHPADDQMPHGVLMLVLYL